MDFLTSLNVIVHLELLDAVKSGRLGGCRMVSESRVVRDLWRQRCNGRFARAAGGTPLTQAPDATPKKRIFKGI